MRNESINKIKEIFIKEHIELLSDNIEILSKKDKIFYKCKECN